MTDTQKILEKLSDFISEERDNTITLTVEEAKILYSLTW